MPDMRLSPQELQDHFNDRRTLLRIRGIFEDTRVEAVSELRNVKNPILRMRFEKAHGYFANSILMIEKAIEEASE